MFDLTTTTILSLVVPTIIAPLACLAFVRAIGRAEAAHNAAPEPVDAQAAPAIVLDSAAAPLGADRVRERQVA